MTNTDLKQIQQKLETIFQRTSKLALGAGDYVIDVEIAAAQASAQVATAIAEIEEIVREGDPVKRLRKFLVEVFIGNTQKYLETVWAESREDAESQVNDKYSEAGTVDITSVKEVDADECDSHLGKGFDSEPE